MFLKNISIVLIASNLLLLSCKQREQISEQEIRQMKKTADQVIKRVLTSKKIVATTNYNSTSYFIYRGEPMGYQYELLKSFSGFLGVKLEIKIIDEPESGIGCLVDNECDLIALGLAITKEYTTQIDFTIPLTQTRQMLVQCKPAGWRKMATADQINAYLIRNPLYLAGKTVYIQKNSIFKNRLQNLSDEIGADINIIEDPEATLEELIGMVARREIEYTISEEYIALVNQKYYPDIDVSTPVSFPQNIAWAVKKEAYGLLDTLNYWLENFKKTRESVFLYNKYFKNTGRRGSSGGGILSLSEGKISLYDDLIKKYSKKIEWDWRLLASLIYQESRFYPDTVAWSGAMGLMQLMPNTAAKYEIDSLSNVENQIVAGVDYIALLDRQFAEKGINTDQRVKFVLASYNAGIAHVYDAQRLAEKYNKDPHVWDNNVDFYLLNKSKPQYYNDSVVKYGYCRGEESYNFVNEIFERFEHYKNMIKEE
jgi:membrane-bound lytic murein transglycosylase F